VQLGVFAVDAAPRSGRAGAPARAPRFRNNRLSAVLREDHPNCIKDIVRHPAGALPCAVSCSRFCLLLRAAACVPREPLTPVQALLSNHKRGEPYHAGHHVNQVAPVSCGACVRSERMPKLLPVHGLSTHMATRRLLSASAALPDTRAPALQVCHMAEDNKPAWCARALVPARMRGMPRARACAQSGVRPILLHCALGAVSGQGGAPCARQTAQRWAASPGGAPPGRALLPYVT